ncbi:MAG: CBS domain-containing protein [Blastocatellia bacterium]|nr:CBS domain-containing protein [Blastocatellia bacterium]MCX7751250.1 CBS domain-containing protein [Blastocatellia bacterium]MDW8256722.1 CBS domain-containing protein [Acidobacteriota bacterium]
MICPSCGHENLPGAEVCEQCMHDLMGLDLPQPKEGLQRRLMEDPVRVLPLRPPVTISPEEPVGRALELMRQHRIGSVLVVEGGKLVGIFTERGALLELVGAPTRLLTRRIREVMTPHPVVLREDDTLAFALHQMSLGGFRRLPVVRPDGTPVGVASIKDILRYIFTLCRS